MSNVYEQEPSIVSVVMTDEDGTVARRHIVGYTLEEVVEAVTLSLDGAGPKPLTKPHRKPRRTKEQMAQAPTAPKEPETSAAHGKPWAD